MTIKTEQARSVYDPLLRVLHWWIAASILALIATSQLAELFEDGASEQTLWDGHVLSGYALTSGLLARLLWGLIGPPSARWRDLWHPATWINALRRLRLPSMNRFGHDPLASLAYLAAYALMALMVVTGLGLTATELQSGPLAGWLGGAGWLEEVFEEPHEAGFALLLGFIGLHLAALVFHRLRGERVAQSMITGKQYRAMEQGVDHV